MADIELAIKIPSVVYEEIHKKKAWGEYLDGNESAIANGIVIPEGHGRLGDLDALEELCSEHKISNSALYNSPIIEQGHYDDGDCIWQPLFDFAPTIIEADTPKRRKGIPLEENDSGYNCENWIP